MDMRGHGRGRGFQDADSQEFVGMIFFYAHGQNSMSTHRKPCQVVNGHICVLCKETYDFLNVMTRATGRPKKTQRSLES